MEIKKGIPVSSGIVIGRALVMDSEKYRIRQRYVQQEDVPAELERFDNARKKVHKDIERVRSQAQDLLQPEIGRIIDTHLSILDDPHLEKEVRDKIENKLYTAERAVSVTMRRFIKAFKSMRDDFFAQRYEDLYDIEKRLLATLLGEDREDVGTLTEEVIIVARDLTPSETADLDRSKVKGLAIETGGRTSHTAIMARSMRIPAIVGLGSIVDDVSGGDTVLIDGDAGVLIVNPDTATRLRYEDKIRSLETYEEEIRKARELPAVTADGVRIRIQANIEFPRDVEDVLSNDAEGIGLFRTEFLFLAGDVVPSEQAHFDAYQSAIRRLQGKPLTIRTLDFGADKQHGAQAADFEANPFLGCRSIRYSFERLDLFIPQLRATLRASAFGPVRVLFPMISSLEEIRRAKFLLDEAKAALEREGISFDRDIPVGAMIEIPSAVMIADFLAREVDFFSIGTNDLIQYTLAVDRVNERVANLFQPTHPAVLRLLRQVVDVGKKRGVSVSVCGEMPGEDLLAFLLLGMDVTEFSVTPAAIPQLKRVVRGVSLEEARKVTRRVFSLPTSDAVLDHLVKKARETCPSIFE